MRQLSEKLGRSPLAIVSRLVRLGLYDHQQAAMQADNARMQALDLPPLWDVPAPCGSAAGQTPAAPPAADKQGAVWTVADDQQLKTLWHSPAQPHSQAIAKQLGRSARRHPRPPGAPGPVQRPRRGVSGGPGAANRLAALILF
ncbi:hypothetical protein JOS77_02805 [Chromobacterium haemolyticum]|nr:hypothetical protein JOS77_02805 [Chromobacterium haemolyticum]